MLKKFLVSGPCKNKLTAIITTCFEKNQFTFYNFEEVKRKSTGQYKRDAAFLVQTYFVPKVIRRQDLDFFKKKKTFYA